MMCQNMSNSIRTSRRIVSFIDCNVRFCGLLLLVRPIDFQRFVFRYSNVLNGRHAYSRSLQYGWAEYEHDVTGNLLSVVIGLA